MLTFWKTLQKGWLEQRIRNPELVWGWNAKCVRASTSKGIILLNFSSMGAELCLVLKHSLRIDR